MASAPCPNCGHRNRPEDRYCVKCGCVLVAAAAQAGAEPPLPVTASGVVYLYGDSFVEGSFLRSRIELPCRGVKVRKNELAETAAAAAFVGLARGRRVKLYTGRRRGTLGIRRHKAVFLDPLGRASAPTSGFEGQILESLSDRQQRNNVVDILQRIVPSSADPWRKAIRHIREGLLEQGYFAEASRGRVTKFLVGRKLVPDCQRIAALQRHVGPTRSMIESFRVTSPEVHAQLTKDIRAAIRAQREMDY